MTKEILELLSKIKNNPIFEENDFFFVGGTALSHYLNHRISYDIDIASTQMLPVSQIKSFVYALGGRAISDKNASQFRINTGQDIEKFHLKFMVDSVKLEFTYFKHEIQTNILKNSKYQPVEDGATLNILSSKDIASLKIFALFNRQKTRDLFDAFVILQQNLMTYEELENLYSFLKKEDQSIRDYIDLFSSFDDDGDNSLDFMPGQEHYKAFAKKEQKKRFDSAKALFLEQYDKEQKKSLSSKNREILKFKKDKKLIDSIIKKEKKNSLQEFAGMWEDRDIDQKDLRGEAWKR